MRCNGNAPCFAAFASESLRDDWSVVLAAVVKNGLALQHPSEKLKEDVVHKACDTRWHEHKKSLFGDKHCQTATENGI